MVSLDEKRGVARKMRDMASRDEDYTGRDLSELIGVNYWSDKLCWERLADLIDPGEDVSMSAYDLLPEEEREAIRWVREHGGLDALRHRVDVALAREPVAIGMCSLLGMPDDSLAGDIMDEIRARTMPEGMEWLVEAWPRFEDDAPVRLLDDFERYGEENGVSAVTMYADGSFALNCRAYSKGEPVKRPAPKVLDADGAEIRVGDRVWSTQLDEPHEWIVIDPHEDRDDSQTVLVSIGGRTGHARPENLTHRSPVPAADGEPLEVGQTVWNEVAVKFKVEEINPRNKSFTAIRDFDGSRCDGLNPMCFTHQRPVLDADGVPIKVGDTVWFVGGGEPAEVAYTIEADASHPDEVVLKGYEDDWPVNADKLTHTKPEIDSWERIEEDAEKGSCDYFGCDANGCHGCPAYDWNTARGGSGCGNAKMRDLVRRARALAGRDR